MSILSTHGIHHVTAIAGNAQRNVDFYIGALGLRLVKKTVNFDDPTAYHLYYGDMQGNPGTILTFFIWNEMAPRGEIGDGQVETIAFSIPHTSFSFWQRRLQQLGIHFEESKKRFQEQVLSLKDYDGIQLELVATSTEQREGWHSNVIPTTHAIRGIHSVTLALQESVLTEQLLTSQLGFKKIAVEEHRVRYGVEEGKPGQLVDIVIDKTHKIGHMGVGTIHHVAWRSTTDEEQASLRSVLIQKGYGVTPVRDRNYFHSIYFREPGGVLFEIATDPPGFTIDESVENLGSELRLPDWLEPKREMLEEILPPLLLPSSGGEYTGHDSKDDVAT